MVTSGYNRKQGAVCVCERRRRRRTRSKRE